MIVYDDEWQEWRKGVIGGSDAPIICGVSPYETATELFYKKQGVIPPDPENQYMEWGKLLEPVVAEAFVKRFGVNVWEPPERFVNKKRPWQVAQVDRLTDYDSETLPTIVEIKTTADIKAWGQEMTSEIPDHVMIQVQHQFAVTGLQMAYVVTLILPTRKMKIYLVDRDEELINAMNSMEEDFYHRLQRNDPPPVMPEHPAAKKLMEKMYYGTDGTTIDLPEDMIYYTKVYQDAREQKKHAEAVMEGCKNRIAVEMKKASVGVLPDGRKWKRRVIQKPQYTIEASEYTVMYPPTKK